MEHNVISLPLSSQHGRMSFDALEVPWCFFANVKFPRGRKDGPVFWVKQLCSNTGSTPLVYGTFIT